MVAINNTHSCTFFSSFSKKMFVYTYIILGRFIGLLEMVDWVRFSTEAASEEKNYSAPIVR